MVIFCKVLAKEHDILDYQHLVIENLDDKSFGNHYFMCTVWPNWESRIPNIDEVGYCEIIEVKAGIDKWYDPNANVFVPYKFDNVQFVRFVKKVDSSRKDIIL